MSDFERTSPGHLKEIMDWSICHGRASEKFLTAEVRYLRAALEKAEAELKEALKANRDLNIVLDNVSARAREYYEQSRKLESEVKQLKKRDGILIVDDGTVWKDRAEAAERSRDEAVKELEKAVEVIKFCAQWGGKSGRIPSPQPGSKVDRCRKYLGWPAIDIKYPDGLEQALAASKEEARRYREVLNRYLSLPFSKCETPGSTAIPHGCWMEFNLQVEKALLPEAANGGTGK